MQLNVAFDAASQANWAVVGEYWANVLRTEPRPYDEMMGTVTARRI